MDEWSVEGNWNGKGVYCGSSTLPPLVELSARERNLIGWQVVGWNGDMVWERTRAIDH